MSAEAGVTAEVYKTIVTIIDERVKEIKVKREDFNALRDVVEELAQAQRRTEQRVEELAQAQCRTEEAVERLVGAQRELSVAVGKLSDNFGYGIEDIGRVVLPGYLERHFDINVVGELDRKFFFVNGKEIELNLYGEGLKGGNKVIILGEAKAKIYRGEVKEFIKAMSKLTFKDAVFKLMFGFLVHPSATEVAKSEGIVLVASYQK